MDIISKTSNLIDSAIGPVTLAASTLSDFDIDDYVHTTVRSQAIKNTVVYQASVADPRLADNRTPVDLEGITLGGF
jgi:hypothetical protein